MKIGQTDTFVLSMSQTQIDGRFHICDLDQSGPDETMLPELGQVWSWQGRPIRLEGAQGALRLEETRGETQFRDRVRRRVQKTARGAALRSSVDDVEIPYLHSDQQPLSRGFTVSDGTSSFTLVPIGRGANRALWCASGLPDPGRPYVVVQVAENNSSAPQIKADDVICFTRGTRIATPNGPVAVEDLRPGHFVSTRDDGQQEVLWIGKRHISGARLYVMPHLRPVRLRAGALESGQPDQDLLVSPQHRMLVRNDKARALFGSKEVLIGAEDLIDNRAVFADYTVKSVDYFHLLLPRHAVLWANGVASESYHPANSSLDMVAEDQRAELLGLMPELSDDPHSYGPYARRNLTRPEAVILMKSDT